MTLPLLSVLLLYSLFFGGVNYEYDQNLGLCACKEELCFVVTCVNNA